MKTSLRSALCSAALMMFALGSSARAEQFVFTFNSLSAGATTSQLVSYMNGILTSGGCSGCSVMVMGAYVDTNYTADGNVVGPNGTPDTLGDVGGVTGPAGSETPITINNSSTPAGSYTSYLATVNQSNTGQNDTQITMTFSGLSIGSVGFDYEIFPEFDCQSLSSCGSGNPPANLPDFEFTTGAGAGTNVFTQHGAAPSTCSSCPAHTGGDGTSTKDGNNTIYGPQYLGTWSGSVGNVTQLNFVDWPAAIGVDNLIISTPMTSTPEPASVVLLTTVMFLVFFALRRRLRGAIE